MSPPFVINLKELFSAKKLPNFQKCRKNLSLVLSIFQSRSKKTFYKSLEKENNYDDIQITRPVKQEAVKY